MTITMYEVRYMDKRGLPGGFTVGAKDPKHAMSSVMELCPEARRITSVLPVPQF